MPISPVIHRPWATAVLTILLDNLDAQSIRAARGHPLYELWRAARENDPSEIRRVLMQMGYPAGAAASLAPAIDAVATS
jgi:hypothetical protein